VLISNKMKSYAIRIALKTKFTVTCPARGTTYDNMSLCDSYNRVF